MFKEWDNIYRKIRTEKIEKGLDEISPSDTSGLYKINVMNRLQRDHKTTWKVNGIEVPQVK